MELIVLKGNPNRGKTETLNIVYQFLLVDGYKQIPGFFKDLKHGDFIDVLSDPKGRIIGIVTQGDYPKGDYSVGNHLKYLENAKCIKTICAQTLGDTKERIAKTIATYTHKHLEKKEESDKSLQRIVNHKDAIKIKDMLSK